MHISPATALRIDAAGCFAGAAILFISTTVWSWTGLPSGARLPVAVCLFLFLLLLVAAERTRNRQLIALAVLGNLGWIAAGAWALFLTDSAVGGVLIAVVMIADALMAWLQSRAVTDRSR